ncbi:MAG: response regulator [Acaryochloridaceae cyanobacterium RU_4_10]|nr:response regulator [Acaryochloridaceae cyanobacterium RU_4_10]
MFPKRVLIIDDDTAIRIVVKISLSKLGGYDVLDASSGLEGLAIALQEHPDAIILDLAMPKMNGFEVLQQLQQNPLTQTIPVVLLTANADQVQRGGVVPIGIVDTIAKPFDALTLPHQVAAACGWA